MYLLCNLLFSLICDHFPLLRSTTMHHPDIDTSIKISVAYQLKIFYIDVSNSSNGSLAETCANEDQSFQSSETRVYTCRNYLKGRYVRIRHPSDYQECLHLCEVQVQGMARSIHTLTCVMM